jgi:hypothetical protein
MRRNFLIALLAIASTIVNAAVPDSLKKDLEDYDYLVSFVEQNYAPFDAIMQKGYGQLSLTRYRNHVIGCSAVVFSHGNAYLWYAAFRRKSFAFVHPDVLTIWHAIKEAHRQGYDHIFFLDVGLPFRKNRFRDFILRFGGKPVSTYRWFRTSIGWLNKLLSWIYRD